MTPAIPRRKCNITGGFRDAVELIQVSKGGDKSPAIHSHRATASIAVASRERILENDGRRAKDDGQKLEA